MLVYYFKLAYLSLRKTPALSSLIVVAIALGIGLSMTTYTVVHMMSLDPIPSKSQQLFAVQLDSFGKGNRFSTPDGLQHQITYKDAMNLFESDIPSHQTRMLKGRYAVGVEDKRVPPFMEAVRFCDADFFHMFNVDFIYGEPWRKSVDRDARYEVVISESMSERVFGEVDSIGLELLLGDHMFTVVGVIREFQPAPFFYDLNGNHFSNAEKIFAPFSLLPVIEVQSGGNQVGWLDEKINNYQDALSSELLWIQYWAELATPELQQQYRDYLAGYIEEQKKFARFEKDDAKGVIRDVRQWLLYNGVVSEDDRILVGLGFLFLVVCLINTVGLLLAKLLRSVSEAGIRRALGASKKDILFQYLTEMILIGLLGGGLGLLFTWLGLQGLKSMFYSYQKFAYLDGQIVVYTIMLSVGAAIVAGLMPAIRICTTQPSLYLKAQ